MEIILLISFLKLMRLGYSGSNCLPEPSSPTKSSLTSGFKAAKDRLMLLLGANVSGTLELKALLV